MTARKLNLRLALISNDRETLDGVQQYFQRLGARISIAPRLEDAAARTSGADAALLFADDYPHEEALRVIPALSVKLVVVVTADVGNFRVSLPAERRADRVLVLPRPAWGWMLLDAVRHGVPLVGEA